MIGELESRIAAFVELGLFLESYSNEGAATNHPFTTVFEEAMQNAEHQNAWFTRANIRLACKQWARALSVENLKKWLSSYDLRNVEPIKVAIIAPGNVPLVAFHDVLSALVLGHTAIVKTSHKDDVLLRFVASFLQSVYPKFRQTFIITTDRLLEYDAVIATGSGNSSRYFEYYFGQVPHIIRKNRSSLAILNGKESLQDFKGLAADIFSYFGLGCRNVCKLYVPRGYDFRALLEVLETHKDVINHNKYANNYDYNKTVYLMCRYPFLDTGFVILKEDAQLKSPLAVIFYEYYDHQGDLMTELGKLKDQIQCVVSNQKGHVAFGSTQSPDLSDYADNVDTVGFLLKK